MTAQLQFSQREGSVEELYAGIDRVNAKVSSRYRDTYLYLYCMGTSKVFRGEVKTSNAYIYLYIHVYINMCILCIYICIYIYVCVCIHIYI